ncbi:MAG: hypothetical protein KDE22_16385 [Rhodobacterales bacterium]|nr:hypothetical protein [Rhodobacterales bacterium]
MTFLEWTEGPLWYGASAIFVVGAAWRLFGILRLGRRVELSRPRASAASGALAAIVRHALPRGEYVERTWYHVVAGYLFHLGLFALLLFAAPHVAFIHDRLLGVGWTPLPRWAFIVVAELAFAGLILLWVRRICDPVMRQISDRDDHLGTWLTFIAMLTGCLALQETSPVLRGIHMLCVEVWMVYFPFSRLMHAFTWVLSRGFMGANYGRRGVSP